MPETIDRAALLRALQRTRAYPHHVKRIEHLETHLFPFTNASSLLRCSTTASAVVIALPAWWACANSKILVLVTR